MRAAYGLAFASLVWLGSLPGSAASASPSGPRAGVPADNGPVLHLPVTVMTQDGASVRGLTEADFTITEDGQSRPLQAFKADNVPLSLAIIVDTGPMMRGPWMGDTFGAVRQLLSDVLGPEDEACLYVFGREPVQLQKWAARETLLASHYRVPDAGSSPLYETMARASVYTDEAKHVRRAVIVVSGGRTTDGWRRPPGPAFAPPMGATASAPSLALNQTNEWEPSPERERALKAVKERTLVFYSIGLSTPRPSDKKVEPPPPVNNQELRDVSEHTGGYLQLVDAPEQLADAVSKLKDELRNQYLLSYVPAANADGKSHEVRVTVKNPDYRVRVRQSYLASTDRKR